MLDKYLGAFPNRKSLIKPQPSPSPYDPSKLTDEEWRAYQRIRKKAMVGPEEASKTLGG